MIKVLKILSKFLLGCLEWILILVLVLAFAVRTSWFQTWAGEKATSYLSKELNTKVNIDKIDITFIDRAEIDGLLLLDLTGDTIAYANSLFVNLDSYDLTKKEFFLGNVELDKAVVKIKKYKTKDEFNFQFLVDYFKSDSNSESKPFELRTANLHLNDVSFEFDDANSPKTEFGMDYSHLKFTKLNLNAENIVYKPSGVQLKLEGISTIEQNGLELNSMSGNVDVSSSGAIITEFNLETPNSTISAPKFALLTNSYKTYTSFVDSVDFDVIIDKSNISLFDVSLFAPALEGMEQNLNLTGSVSDKVKNLKLSQFELKTGEKTYIQGEFRLPDFRDLKSALFQEKITNMYIDLSDIQRIKLPKTATSSYIELPNQIQRLDYLKGKDLSMIGYYSEFVIQLDKLQTDLGGVEIDNGIQFEYDQALDRFNFGKVITSEYDIFVDDFQLGEFLENNDLDKVAGRFNLNGNVNSKGDFNLTEIEGVVDVFDYNSYQYSGITIADASFVNQKFEGELKVKDKNLDLEYKGFLDLKNTAHLNFQVNLNKVILENLNLSTRDSSFLSAKDIRVDWHGLDPEKFEGTVSLIDLEYDEGEDSVKVEDLTLNLTRSNSNDKIIVNSSLLEASIEGQINFQSLLDNLEYQFSQVFPVLVSAEQKDEALKSNFNYNLKIKEIQPVFDIFLPELYISSGTELFGNYNETGNEFNLNLRAQKIAYQDYFVKNVSLDQELNGGQLIALYDIEKAYLNDTVNCENFHFTTIGYDNILDSQMSWNDTTSNPSSIAWTTSIISKEEYSFNFHESFFTIKNHRWDIQNNSEITYAPDSIAVNQFKIERLDQFISLDGLLSNNESDKLNVKIKNLDLNDFSSFIDQDIKLDGIANAEGKLSTPFTNISFDGDVEVDSLFINDEEVGNIEVNALYDNTKDKIVLDGDLKYKNVETFTFDGSYFIAKEKDNLDFNLIFDGADLDVVNAFMDPDVVSNIGGLLKGKLKVLGSPDKPELKGSIDLTKGNAKLALLGANFKFGGEINIDEYGIYVDNMPITDEEGHTGSMVGQVFHDNFTNFNFDLSFNLEDDAVNRDPYQPYKIIPLEKFLVMNTTYKEGDVYYGKAYVTGTASVSGFADNMEINVDVKSERGSWIDFPMYGASEITEDNFISINPTKDSIRLDTVPLIDFTGVDMNLNIEVTPDTRLKLIFDEKIGDEITAYGQGDLEIKLDNFGELAMEGLFTVDDGVYNFAMGPYKQNFYIQPGGTVQWTGSPYEASLDVSTFYKTNANISVVMNEVIDGRSSDNEEIYCYLYLDGEMTKPNISFDILAPKATEAGKSVINRIRSEKDELNRQFFSLMIAKRFQPINSSQPGGVGGGAALDLLSTQINSLLSSVSKDYKLNVALDSDELTGENSYELGVSKGFLDDRLIVSGSFGVENRDNPNAAQQSNFVGDVSVEYLLNESGTFRVNVFNESNDYSIIQDNNVGQFTQGVGLHYQEDFQNLGDFKLFQYIADVFRKKENKKYKYTSKSTKSPVPQKYKENPSLLKQELETIKEEDEEGIDSE